MSKNLYLLGPSLESRGGGGKWCSELSDATEDESSIEDESCAKMPATRRATKSKLILNLFKVKIKYFYN